MGDRKGRTSGGQFAPGHKLGGRPQVSLKAALQRISDPHAIAALVYGWIFDEKMPMSDRKWAIEFHANRTEGKPTSVIEATINRAAGDDRPLTDEEFFQCQGLLRAADESGETAH